MGGEGLVLPPEKASLKDIQEEKASSVNVEAKVSKLLEQEAADI